MQCDAVYHSQCVAACCRVSTGIPHRTPDPQTKRLLSTRLQSVAVCCMCVAVCCSVLQRDSQMKKPLSMMCPGRWRWALCRCRGRSAERGVLITGQCAGRSRAAPLATQTADAVTRLDLSKEPHVPSKQSYIFSKEPYIRSREHILYEKSPVLP